MSAPRTPSALSLALQSRRMLGSPRRAWRRSLRVRTVAITVLLSSLALVGVGAVVAHGIAGGLFADRLAQVLAESARASGVAQNIADGVSSTDQASLDIAQLNAIDAIQAAARPKALVWDRSASGVGVGSITLGGEGARSLVTDSLRASLSGGDASQRWQSIAIPRSDGGDDPGIVVGDVIGFGQGSSELYLVYDIQDVQDTLNVVQRSLLIGGLVLLVLIAAVTAVVASLIVAPIKQAAGLSQQLAAGRLEQRIPERGDDVVTTLARSFNRMAESLQRQIGQLANLSRVQQRFVSDVSHELRTPLTTIRLATDVLYDARSRYDAPTARSAELLKTQVVRFEALLADLLEISRMDAQAAELSGEPTSLVDVARESIDSLGGLADETGTSITLVAPGGHVAVEVDGRRIARVVRNLLANALEHGEGRSIVVTVDSSQQAVALGVRDHGIGMSEEHAERVFDRFWRADPSRQRRIGGTGLGLAISLEDALLHGGALEVWSRRGDGTNFVLTLPRGPGEPEFDRPVPLRPLDAQSDGDVRVTRLQAGVLLP